MLYLKVVCGFVCCLILASNVLSMSHWNESRVVYDDICYLRQAHLFQRFGLGGLDTNLVRDDDHYLAPKLAAIGYPATQPPPCHTLMPATNKRVMQYPPGTGFVLAAFPEGFQVIPLYVVTTAIIFALALFGIYHARSAPSVYLTAAFGCVAIYLMINPTKASYSMAPTMVACALAGLLTACFFSVRRRSRRLLLAGGIGLIIGLSVNFRLPNLLLASGYGLFFLLSFLRFRKTEVFLQGALFAVLFLLGAAPTLVANAINAGSPLSTTYGGVDVTPPDFSFGIVWQYVADMQFVLLVLAVVWTVLMWRSNSRDGVNRTAFVTAGNLLLNIAFFMSHPIFTPYYTIPIAMLSLWSLLFASLTQSAEKVGDRIFGRAAWA
jgi:hypothetical protein